MKVKTAKRPKKSKPTVYLKDIKPTNNPKAGAIGRIEPRFPRP